MKYDTQLTQLQSLAPAAESFLVVLPTKPSNDQLAAALALYLSFEQSGKKGAVVTESVIRVEHTNLFSINQVQNEIPNAVNGNLTIVLGGVVDPKQGKPPTLQELKWHPVDSDLHLVFLPVPGQRFEPTHITPTFEGGKFDLIFVIGAQNLEDLGNIYKNKIDIFTSTHIVNIDNKEGNAQFGQTNVVDSSAASVSEIVSLVLTSLGFPVEGDAASNILTGIYQATDNLQSDKVNADTFLAISSALRAGGQKPNIENIISKPKKNVVSEEKKPLPQSSMSFETQTEEQPQPESSPEEAPSGEAATTVNPESDWLVPKVYKGSSIG